MTLEIDYPCFANIPCTSICPQDTQPKGLVFAYHGWTVSKEDIMDFGQEIAQCNLLVIMPDAYQHGQRQTVSDQEQNFLESLWMTFQEFPQILQAVQDRWGTDLPISVTGISMGGIISGMLFYQHLFIQKAGILMGTFNLEEFLDSLSQSYLHQPIETTLSTYHLPKEFLQYDLSQNISRIGDRELYIWHGKNDEVVPFSLMNNFVSQAHRAGFGEHITFDISEEIGHSVPAMIKKVCAEFLSNL